MEEKKKKKQKKKKTGTCDRSVQCGEGGPTEDVLHKEGSNQKRESRQWRAMGGRMKQPPATCRSWHRSVTSVPSRFPGGLVRQEGAMDLTAQKGRALITTLPCAGTCDWTAGCNAPVPSPSSAATAYGDSPLWPALQRGRRRGLAATLASPSGTSHKVGQVVTMALISSNVSTTSLFPCF